MQRMLILMLFLLSPWAVANQADYRLGAGDRIQIKVYGESDLSFDELFITSTGQFEYPYIGRITAINKTTRELTEQITRELKGDYLVDPKVMVSILSFRKIYVNGEVKKPGGYEYQPGLTIDKAIALAGGFTDRAARSKISVTNNTTGNDTLKARLSNQVQPGDIITIEESFF
ncbi:polysaccharide biosynthesis/export family protein [Vibrio agarivorans]|uniref:polysaccharide biosynthesis/export family protein n=1 Tax=Vibrio agarivorans TaxID=153622 RepID=UPI00222FE57D|nr:polysaccharide biosynthesis/export family protein [Vibrio agarivorans]MDN3660797.1 polysaccharide biosynthesis/export family protein [Vibrio agarivorans]